MKKLISVLMIAVVLTACSKVETPPTPVAQTQQYQPQVPMPPAGQPSQQVQPQVQYVPAPQPQVVTVQAPPAHQDNSMLWGATGALAGYALGQHTANQNKYQEQPRPVIVKKYYNYSSNQGNPNRFFNRRKK